MSQFNGNQGCELYRYFDANNTLLYVGISLSAVYRASQHRDSSPWYGNADRITLQRFKSRAEAITAETKAIQTEKPKFNIKGKVTIKAVRAYKAEARKIWSERMLTMHIVAVQPLYSIHEACQTLNLQPSTLELAIKNKVLSCGEIEVVWRGETKKRRVITGWQLLDYLEHIQNKSTATTDDLTLALEPSST